MELQLEKTFKMISVMPPKEVNIAKDIRLFEDVLDNSDVAEFKDTPDPQASATSRSTNSIISSENVS